ncbi:MAG: hypothetical protein AB1410_08805 [Acidobacteriota bacterium]
MDKKFVKIVLLLFFINTFLSFPEEEKIVEISASIKPYRIMRGEGGKIILNMRLKKGNYISSAPLLNIEIKSNDGLAFSKNFYTSSDLNIPVIEKDGIKILDVKSHFEIPFKVKEEARPGFKKIEMEIKFFVYSLKSNLCIKYSNKISSGYYIRSKIFRKKIS